MSIGALMLAMTTWIEAPTVFALRTVVASLALVSVSVAGATGDTTVYRCTQANGAVLYADYPCKGGVAVDIRPGAPDPDATQRLERIRAELDRAAARRQANEDFAAIRREELYQRRLEAEAAQSAELAANPPDLIYGPAYGFPGSFVKGRTNRPGHQRHADRHHVTPKSRVPAVIRRPHGPG